MTNMTDDNDINALMPEDLKWIKQSNRKLLRLMELST
jgi:hypothetical protein